MTAAEGSPLVGSGGNIKKRSYRNAAIVIGAVLLVGAALIVFVSVKRNAVHDTLDGIDMRVHTTTSTVLRNKGGLLVDVLELVFANVLKSTFNWATDEIEKASVQILVDNESQYDIYSAISNSDDVYGIWEDMGKGHNSYDLELKLQRSGFEALFIVVQHVSQELKFGYLKLPLSLVAWGDNMYYTNSFYFNDSVGERLRRRYQLTTGYLNMISHTYQEDEPSVVSTENWEWIHEGHGMWDSCKAIVQRFGIDVPNEPIGSAVWSGATAMTTLNNRLFITSNSELYEVDPTTGDKTKLGTSEWGGTEAMTSLDGFLYMVQRSNLYRASPSDGTYTPLGRKDDWSGTDAMAALGGNLYIVQGDTLYRANPADGVPTRLGPENEWSGTAAMTTWGDNLYIVQKKTLYKVSPNDGSFDPLGKPEWGTTRAMATLNDTLYITQKSTLYVVNPIDGTYIPLGDGWSSTVAMVELSNIIYIVAGSKLYAVFPPSNLH